MRRTLTIIALAFLPFIAKSQQIEYFNDLMSDMYNFAIYEPAGYDPVNSTNMPVVMFLHGRSMSIGLGGYRYGSITAIQGGYEILKGQPALIVEPNANGNEGWGSVKLHKVYEFLKAHYAFDHNKFYVIGMSMGGWGTLNYVNKYPDEVAACVGICGGCDAKTPCGLNKVPTWIIHAADDETTAVACSDRVVEAMKACGSTNLLKYSRLTSGGHSLINYFNYYNLYSWLFKHNRTNRRFDTSIDFVNNPEYPSVDEYSYWGGYSSVEGHEITQAELERVKARTPRQQGNSPVASSGGSTSTNSGTTSTTTSANNNNSNNNGSNNNNSSNTTKPTATSKPTNNNTNNTKPTTTNKPAAAATATAKPASTSKPTNTATATAIAKPATSSEKGTYIVKQGDTLKKIAKKHKIKYKKLLQINHFTKDKKIKVGDKIKIA
ncbi:MAG: LysM peptidoglycan-binding domain-containing protein [Bacteroidales bacterium]|nr:LysM peptidoglycan-binding domain-containing protein [Bacteroidales bacterium]